MKSLEMKWRDNQEVILPAVNGTATRLSQIAAGQLLFIVCLWLGSANGWK